MINLVSDKPHYENVPFEIPDSWEWVTLGEISNYGQTKHAGVDKINNIDWVLELEDIEKDSAQLVQKLNRKERNISGVRSQFEKGQILYSKLRTYLNKVLVAPSNGYCTTEIIPFSCFGSINNHYITQVLRSKYFIDYTILCCYGCKMPRLGTDDAKKGLIPLPPINEQKRIVSTIEKWFELIDKLENSKKELQEAVKQVKSKVLELAIHGKLVPQDPNDEPAIELLKRINPNFKPCDTSHYENLPAGWSVCLIKDLYLHTTGKALKKTNQIGVQRKYITTSNLYWNRFDFSEVRTMYFNEKELDKCTVKKGDLLVCNGGDVGRAAIWKNEEPICYQNHISRLRPVHRSIVVNKFYYYIFMYLKGKSLLNGKGVAINSLSASDILSMDVPFPPVEEQKRISEEIDVTFALLDTISAEL